MIETTAQTKETATIYPKIYIVGLVLGILLLIPTLIMARKHQLNGVSAQIFYFFNNMPDVFKIPSLIATEALGAAYPIILCIAIPAFYKRFRLAWLFFVTVGGTGVMMEFFKLIAKEPRPAALLNGNLHQRAIEVGLNSFPSGHMAVATAMALTLLLILPKAWRWVAVAWMVIVGVSRIYLGVHTLGDVVGGFAIALSVFCVIQLLPKVIAKPLHLDKDKPLLERGF